MLKLDASKSGSFRIGGEIEVNRLGFGAMRLTGPGIWGPPADRAEAIRTLKRVPELGINFIDTADSYGPNVSERHCHVNRKFAGQMTMAATVHAATVAWRHVSIA